VAWLEESAKLHRAPDSAAALERARWLAELLEAINQAQRIAWRLGVAEGDCEEARDLYARLEAVRNEVDALRFGDWTALRSEIDPNWIQLLLNDASLLPGA
jgi:hypothetical protein